jgi:hypothetical protein
VKEDLQPAGTIMGFLTMDRALDDPGTFSFGGVRRPPMLDPLRRESQQSAAASPYRSMIPISELEKRPSRAPDFTAECRALLTLGKELAASPERILQKLAETTLTLCRAQSAGLSLLEPDGERFYWPAIAGAWADKVGGGTPRNYSPCGVVLD